MIPSAYYIKQSRKSNSPQIPVPLTIAFLLEEGMEAVVRMFYSLVYGCFLYKKIK